jgi:hypothetical protein
MSIGAAVILAFVLLATMGLISHLAFYGGKR